MPKNRCHAKTKKGQPCTVGALTGTKLCFMHTPGMATYVGTRGGQRRSLIISRDGENATTSFAAPTDVRSQAQLLAQLQVDVRNGAVPTRVASTIATLANSYLGALELIEFGEKLKELEARLGVESPLDRLDVVVPPPEEEQVQ